VQETRLLAMVLDLARMTQKSLSERLKSAPFSISTDGSNDATSKQYPLVVRTKNTETGLVNSELLSIPVCSEAAMGQNIFNLMDKNLTDRNVTWEKCLSMGSDNASVMTGRHKGVYAYVKEKQPTVYLSGCVLHLIHILAKKAADALPSIDDVLIDIYYYFNNSDSRKLSFKGFQDLYDLEQKRMLKHVCTRWLSIGRCTERLLFNWDALKDYFYKEFSLIEKKKAVKDAKAGKDAKARKDTKAGQKSESSKRENDKYEPSYAPKKVDSIFSFIKSPTNKLFTLFFSYTINVYDEVLKNLQAEDPRIHKFRGALHSVMRNILSRFVKPSAMVGKLVDEVQFKLSCNQKVDNHLVIGNAAKEYIKNKEKNHLRDHHIREFYSAVRQYFVNACEYITSNLPQNEPLLLHAEIADTDKQSLAKQSSVEFFVDRFPSLIPEGSTKDNILEQFVLYQSQNIQSLVEDCKRIDEKWVAIGQVRNEGGSLMFHELAEFMLAILCIPHSSAHCEMVFSVVRKNRTDQRASLGNTTIEALLVIKSRPGHPCDVSRKHSNETLDRLKSSYYKQLNE